MRSDSLRTYPSMAHILGAVFQTISTRERRTDGRTDSTWFNINNPVIQSYLLVEGEAYEGFELRVQASFQRRVRRQNLMNT